jgi:hypothetical protein
MPTLRDIRDRTENYAQQVRSFASQSLSYVRERASAFNECVTGKNQNNDQNWSTTTSERNLSTGFISSKNKS